MLFSPAGNYPSAQTTVLQDQGIRFIHKQNSGLPSFRLIQKACQLANQYPDSAILVLDQALQTSRQSGYSWGVAKSLQLYGIIYSHSGRFEQGIERLMQLIYYCLTTGRHTELLVLGYNILGNIYQTQGKYKEAAYYYHQTLQLPKEHVDPSTVALVYANLSRLTHKLKQPRKALYHLEQAETIAIDKKLYDLLCTINSQKGMIYAETSKTDSAIYYLRKATNLIKAHSHRYNLQDVEYTNMVYLADLWLQQGNLDSSGVCIKRIHEIQTPVVPFYWTKAYLASGKFYLQSGNYKRAEYYLLTVLDSAQSTNANNDLANIHLTLTKLYNATGNCQKALRHNLDYVRIKDSLENEKITSNVHQLEVRYRTSEKDRELVSQKLEISRQQNDVQEKNLWITIVTAAMIVLAIVSAALYKKRQADRSLQQKEIQLLKKQQQALQHKQEIEHLKAIMKGEEQERGRLARELHDGIGGMITAIRMNLGRARKKNPEFSASAPLTEIMHMLEDTGTEIRKTAHNLMPDVLVQHSLPEALTIFCDHIHEELPTDLSCEGDFSQLDKATELMLYRMAQELIQNILKHASATQAAIQLYIFEGCLSLTVEDNGTGFDTSEDHHGFGLENLRYRVAALHGDISITSDRNNSTIIHIEFDLDKLKQ